MSGRAAAWLAWSLVALSVASVLGGFILARTTHSVDPTLPYGGADDNVILSSVTVLAFSVVGAVVASGHPRNTIGWLFCAVGLVEALDTLARGYAEYWITGGWGPRSLGETAAWFASWAWVMSGGAAATFLLLLFPDGRLPSSRWRPVAWCAGLGIVGFFMGFALRAGPLEDFPQITNPYGVDSPIVEMATVAGGFVVVGSFVASAISLIVRARHASSEQRQQIKWIAYGGAILTLGLVQRWGEVFPRWIPFVGGKRVPIPFAVFPASLVAVLVTTAGLMFVRLTLTGRLGAILGEGVLSAENWAALAPELLWPLWGGALGAATLAYYYRRRGKCEHCGRL
jgi:hypothetical protein